MEGKTTTVLAVTAEAVVRELPWSKFLVDWHLKSTKKPALAKSLEALLKGKSSFSYVGGQDQFDSYVEAITKLVPACTTAPTKLITDTLDARKQHVNQVTLQ